MVCNWMSNAPNNVGDDIQQQQKKWIEKRNSEENMQLSRIKVVNLIAIEIWFTPNDVWMERKRDRDRK